MNDRLKNRKLLFAGVGVVAACVAVALILVSVLGSSADKSGAATTTTVEKTATAPAPAAPETLSGAAATTALFAGIPQRLNQLGDPKAPVTMIEFADLQCPYCKAYAVDALPGIVKSYVRTGKVKLIFSGMHFVGPDSEKALRAVYAAGLQGKLWNVLDLLYRNQGAENSGWVSDGLLTAAGNSIPGFDAAKMTADSTSAEVEAGLSAGDQQANQAHVNSTPTFFAGPTGGTLQHLNVTALTFDGFKPLLEPFVQ
jgi:protein-disulfide isomerase